MNKLGPRTGRLWTDTLILKFRDDNVSSGSHVIRRHPTFRKGELTVSPILRRIIQKTQYGSVNGRSKR